MSAFGYRSASSSVELPGPQPTSTILRSFAAGDLGQQVAGRAGALVFELQIGGWRPVGHSILLIPHNVSGWFERALARRGRGVTH